MESPLDLTQRFRAYFERDVAQQAAKSIADGALIEIQIQKTGGEITDQFHFTRVGGKNEIRAGAALKPQLIYILTPQAAEELLNDPSQEIPTIGINIMKLIVSADANRRISVKVRAGFLELFTQGYFGVITSGGQKFAAHLATMGLNGIGAIKNTLKNLKN